MNDLDKATLYLKLAAQDTSDRALVAFYKPGDEFYLETLRESVERLEKALAEYHKAKESDQEIHPFGYLSKHLAEKAID